MQKLTLLLISSLFLAHSLMADPPGNLKDGFTTGNPEIGSISALAFGPDGILFIGDSRRAQVVALDTKDNQEAPAPASLNFQKVDEYIASLLGVYVEEVSIQDMAVNPLSKAIYLAVQLQDGTPVLLRTRGDGMEPVALENASYSQIALQNALGPDAKDQRGRSIGQWAVSDLAYHDGKVMVSGLSNEEFSSAFRIIPFPFKGEQTYASLEIYHASHGRYETYAPIKTFMPYELKGKLHLVASYTCTPLVIVPLESFQAGKHTKGQTVAELGNRNTPLDIISYQKDGKPFLLMANTSRALMKIDPAQIEAFQDFLTEPIDEASGVGGISFINLAYVHVQQLDKFNDEQVVVLQRMDNGDLNLYGINSNRL